MLPFREPRTSRCHRHLGDRVGITMANISVLKNGKVKAIRPSTLDAICRA
ncbi:MAG TPA: helix-turn-helix domain-containing protein [Pyrinomonadaceae bacterium]|nr:helix-turn-helix domain-containing protein [Pyrinomonadaceae bacterium]